VIPYQVPLNLSINLLDGKLLFTLAKAVLSCIIEDTENNYLGCTGGLFQPRKLNCSSDSTIHIHRISKEEVVNNARRYSNSSNIINYSHEVRVPKNAWWPVSIYMTEQPIICKFALSFAYVSFFLIGD
jgi:hypothetical protein